MSRGTKTQGRRLPDHPEDIALDGTTLEPGQYLWDPWRRRWWLCTPNGHLAAIMPGVWTIVQHEDGTITVTPSIKVSNADGVLWHGFLKRGVWEEM